MHDEQLRQLIDTAIQREDEAIAFYRDLGELINEPGAKDAMAWIADEERKHKDFLVKYRDGKRDIDHSKVNTITLYKIAEHQAEPEIEVDMKSADVFLVAAHREKRSCEFYQALAAIHYEGEIQAVLLKMVEEELKHKEKMEYLYANAAFPQTDGG